MSWLARKRNIVQQAPSGLLYRATFQSASTILFKDYVPEVGPKCHQTACLTLPTTAPDAQVTVNGYLKGATYNTPAIDIGVTAFKFSATVANNLLPASIYFRGSLTANTATYFTAASLRYLRVYINGTIRINFDNGAALVDGDVVTVSDDGTSNVNACKLYVNGVLKATSTANGGPAPTSLIGLGVYTTAYKGEFKVETL